MWAEMLRPIIRRFVTAFDGESDITFWSHVAYRNDQVCGQDDLSGWITAFCVWSHKGMWKGGARSLPEDVPPKPEYARIVRVSPWLPQMLSTITPLAKGLGKVTPKWLRRHSKPVALEAREESSPSDGAGDTDSKGDTGTPSEGSVMANGECLAPPLDF